MAPLFAGIGLPVNLRGLAFTDVSMVTQLRDGSPVLVVEGKIVSTGRHTVTVPRLRLAALSASRHEVYAWTAAPARSILSPGESTAFRSELPSPPAETSDVLVRFFHARDVAAGMK
jgi:hypothetical protein